MRTNKLFAGYDRLLEPMTYSPLRNMSERRHTNELIIMNYHRPTRDAFVRQFGWTIRKASRRRHQAASSNKRASAG